MVAQLTWANSRVKQHALRRSNRASSHASSSLTVAQRRNNFTNVAYANAYDAFGVGIMKRDSDVKEVAESSRDASNGYYVILKRGHISSAEARRRTAKYYDAFVSMRRHFLNPAEAQNCSLDVKDSDEQTVASEDQEELRLGP